MDGPPMIYNPDTCLIYCICGQSENWKYYTSKSGDDNSEVKSLLKTDSPFKHKQMKRSRNLTERLSAHIHLEHVMVLNAEREIIPADRLEVPLMC